MHQQRRRSTGPKTPGGKRRSALNAVAWGLTGQGGLLLPGERPSAFRKLVHELIDALRPANAAQRAIVVTVAELHWRQRRWLRAERAMTLKDLEEQVKTTPTFKKLAQLYGAKMALNALIQTTAESAPMRQSDLEPFISGGHEVVKMVGALPEHPERATHQLSQALDELKKPTATWLEAFKTVGIAARVVLQQLERPAQKQERELKRLRRELAASALPSSPDVKRLARYGGTIQRQMLQQLDVLESLRRLSGPAKKTKSGGSFCSAPFEPARLRVVK